MCTREAVHTISTLKIAVTSLNLSSAARIYIHTFVYQCIWYRFTASEVLTQYNAPYAPSLNLQHSNDKMIVNLICY